MIFCSNGNFHFLLHRHRGGNSGKEDDIQARVQLGKQKNRKRKTNKLGKQKKKAKEKEEKTGKKTQVWKAPVLAFYVLMFFFGIFAGVGEFPLQELISKRAQLAHFYVIKSF